ncbi:MAG: carbohydrate ABC transporter permease [Lachnospiraceae bacterium]
MRKKLRPYRYSALSLIVIGLIILFPILYTGYISLTNMNVYHWFDYGLIGLGNYIKALLVFDSGFLPALMRTLLWTAVNMVLQVTIAFFIAVLLNTKGLKFKNLYKTLLMFPWAMPAYVSILLWRMGMYNTEFGLLNQLLAKLGITEVSWLSGSTIAFIACLAVNLWMALPFMIVTIDGALQSIDQSYYESAELEGAGLFSKLRHITIPSIRPIIMPAIAMTTFTTFKQFDIIFLMTQQKGANTGANIHTVITYAYDKAFVTNNYGYSSAISILIFILIIIFTVLTRKMSRRRKYE